MDTSTVIKLKGSDGKVFEINDKALFLSKFLKDLIDNNRELDQEIIINQVDAKNLEKIVEYLKHYETEKPKEIPKPLPSNDLKSILGEWDYNFINPMSLNELVGLINDANFLGIDNLTSLISAKIAFEFLTGTVEEVREKFGIKDDMTEEELDYYDKYPLD